MPRVFKPLGFCTSEPQDDFPKDVIACALKFGNEFDEIFGEKVGLSERRYFFDEEPKEEVEELINDLVFEGELELVIGGKVLLEGVPRDVSEFVTRSDSSCCYFHTHTNE